MIIEKSKAKEAIKLLETFSNSAVVSISKEGVRTSKSVVRYLEAKLNNDKITVVKYAKAGDRAYRLEKIEGSNDYYLTRIYSGNEYRAKLDAKEVASFKLNKNDASKEHFIKAAEKIDFGGKFGI